MKIYHIISKDEWNKVQNSDFYSPASVDNEGVIHASAFEQVMPTAKRRFKDFTDLLVLEIDVEKLDIDVKYVNSPRSNDKHPHICGKLPIEAVTRVSLLVDWQK